MRALATISALSAVLAAASPPGAGAAGRDTALHASRSGVALVSGDVTATLHGSETAGFDRAEIDFGSPAVRARLFRNAALARGFTGSGLRFGKVADSPYLAALGIGDGLSTRVRTGRYSLAAAVQSGVAGNSVATELAVFDGAVAMQAGHREDRRSAGSTSFAGAHADFDLLNAELSVRWHLGWEAAGDGMHVTSAGGVAVGLQSVLEDGDRLRAAMSRPVGPSRRLRAPDLTLRYSTPAALGRLTCSGGLEPVARASSVRLSWGLTW